MHKKGGIRIEDFYARTLFIEDDDRSCRALSGWLYSIKGYFRQTGYLKKISGTDRSVLKQKPNKGHMGGYRLARDPDLITVRQILESAEGSLTPVSCMDDEPNLCDKAAGCLTLPIYKGLYEVIIKYLDGITLADIIQSEKEGYDYYI